MTKKKPRKNKIERPYNNGTMSNAAFWGMIRIALRQKSRWWLPIKECKTKARRPYSGDNNRRKWEYQCKACSNWFEDKEVEIDHIVDAGKLNCKEDVGAFIEKLFCEVDGFQCLCKPCHLLKTQAAKLTNKNS